MPASDGFCALIKDVLEPLGGVAIKRMFGGAGVYCGGVMFAIIGDDTLYLKADETTQREFEAEGLGPFTYTGKSKTIEMSYWRAPERLLDEPDEMLQWCAKALAVARRTQRKTAGQTAGEAGQGRRATAKAGAKVAARRAASGRSGRTSKRSSQP